MLHSSILASHYNDNLHIYARIIESILYIKGWKFCLSVFTFSVPCQFSFMFKGNKFCFGSKSKGTMWPHWSYTILHIAHLVGEQTCMIRKLGIKLNLSFVDMNLAKLDRADVLPTIHPSSNLPLLTQLNRYFTTIQDFYLRKTIRNTTIQGESCLVF